MNHNGYNENITKFIFIREQDSKHSCRGLVQGRRELQGQTASCSNGYIPDCALSFLSAKIYKLIRNLATARKPGDIPYDELVKLVGNHHNPKPSVIVQRFKFHTILGSKGSV